MSDKLIYWGGAALGLFLVARLVAPALQEMSWKEKWDADREQSERAMVEGTAKPMPLEMIVDRPRGMLMAAFTCGDDALAARTEKAMVAFALKMRSDKPEWAQASVARSVERAHNVDPKVEALLKQDCHRTLELAQASIAKWEQ